MTTKTNTFVLGFICVLTLACGQSSGLQWVKQFGGPSKPPSSPPPFSYCSGIFVKADQIANVYTAGWFTGTIDFDPGAGIFNLTSTVQHDDTSDMFVSKLDAAGNFIWAFKIGYFTPLWTGLRVIKLDAGGNLYLAGDFGGTVDFDPGPGVFNLTSTGSGGDAFLCKYNSSGNFLWARQISGTGGEGIVDIVFDNSGDILLTGAYYGIADFDPGSGVFNLGSSPSGASHTFISKFDSGGNFLWAKHVDSSMNWANSVAVDSFNNVYVLGNFNDFPDFDPGPSVFTLTSTPSGSCCPYDLYILKLDLSGNFIWVKQVGGTGYEDAHSIAVDSKDNVYVTGALDGTVDLDPGAGTFPVTDFFCPPYDHETFMLKLNSSGNFVWGRQLGGTSYDEGTTVVIDTSDNIYTVGDFACSADFDPGPGNFFLLPKGSSDVFITKLDQSGNAVWVKQLGGYSYEGGYSIDVDKQGTVYTTGDFFGSADFDPGPLVYSMTPTGYRDAFVHKTGHNIFLGIHDILPASLIEIFPNPTDKVIKVSFGRTVTNVTIKIINLAGEIVSEEKNVNGEAVELDLSLLPGGMYLLEIKEGRDWRRLKFMRN
jgi:hypothetical protein